MATKQKIDIERLLQWAYRDELPKGYRDGVTGTPPAISPMFKWVAFGGPIDNWKREPGFPRAMGIAPHPDALATHAAVMDLADTAIAWPSAAETLLGELAVYLRDEELFAVRAMVANTPGLVTLHARMGNRPIWQMDYRIFRMLGRDRRSALRKGRGRRLTNLEGELRIDPCASEILAARFEYYAWRSALADLAGVLTDLLDHQVLPPAAAAAPWACDDEGVVLPSRLPPCPAAFHTHPRRQRAEHEPPRQPSPGRSISLTTLAK